MGADEVGTLNSLKSHRRELVDCGISEHHDRIVKTTGDGMLVEFASVVDAVACVVKVQRSLSGATPTCPRNGRSCCGSASTSATSSSTATTSSATASTSPGNALRTRRAMHLAGGERPDTGHAVDGVRRSWRAGGKEHRAAVGVFGLTSKDIEAIPDASIPSSADDAAAS
jgi:hypothetical protein